MQQFIIEQIGNGWVVQFPPDRHSNLYTQPPGSLRTYFRSLSDALTAIARHVEKSGGGLRQESTYGEARTIECVSGNPEAARQVGEAIERFHRGIGGIVDCKDRP